MKAKDATLLMSKLIQLKKIVSAIQTDPKYPGSESLKSNSIILLKGLTKDVKLMFENDKKINSNKRVNSNIFNTGYPCKPIKPRN